MRRIIAAALMLGLLAGIVCGQTVVDGKRGFSFTPPPKFTPASVDGPGPQLLYRFTLDDPADGQPDFVISLQPLGGTIGRERPSPADIAKLGNTKLFQTKWRGFMVDGFDRRVTVNGVQLVSFAVQIPLVPEAIQVNITGPAAREAEVRRYMEAALASLDGKSDWIASVTPAEAADSQTYRWVLLTVGVLIVIGGVWILWKVAKRESPGTAIGIAVCFVLVSWGLGFVPLREMLLLCVSLQALGLAGIILGIVLVILRRRKRRTEASGEGPSQQAQ